MLVTATVACVAGLAAGALHALLGPDHLAAVAPISMSRHAAPWKAGLSWGLGHALATWLIAAVALAGWQLIPMDLVGEVSERLVGVVLIGLGLWGLRGLYRNRIHSHAHRHDGHQHVHIHVHGAQAHRSYDTSTHAFHAHVALGIGALHGIAGVGPFLALLPAIALNGSASQLGYVGAFGLGSMLAMAIFSSLVGGVAAGSRDRSRAVYNGLLAAGSGFALVTGVLWLTPISW